MNELSVERPTLHGLVRIAIPMIVSHASETVMMFVDRLFLSWIGPAHISAAMSGGLSAFVFTSLFAGTVGYTNALVAQYYGTGRYDRCIETVSQGVIMSVLFAPLLLLLIPFVELMFRWAGHSPSQIALEFSYFRILMFGSFIVLLRQTLVGFFLGIGQTRVVMIANVVGMTVNLPLNYVLIFGLFGFPELGISGAALGTIGGSVTILLVLLVAYSQHFFVRKYGSLGAWKFRRDRFARLLRFGLPTGVEIFLNVFAFNAFIQLFHSMGEEVAAAVTITFNYDMVAFIPMLGLGVAVTAMVGQQIGAQRPEEAKRAAFLALRVGYSYAAIMMIVFVVGAPVLVRVFTGAVPGDGGSLVKLAVTMIRLAAIYTVADITQLVFAGALRGAGDTKAVMYISVGIHWLMGVASIVLNRVLRLDPLVVWVFFIGFVLTLGIAMVIRFRSGRWREFSVIDTELAAAERHAPDIVTEGQWM